MSVKIRPYRSGGWEVDITVTLDDGQSLRRRLKSPLQSKSGSLRWGRERERHLIKHGPAPREGKRRKPKATRTSTTPTLAEFSPRYIEGLCHPALFARISPTLVA